MQFKRVGVKAKVVSAALFSGLVIGALGSGSALGLDKGPAPVPTFPKNENGQTYGSGLDATSPDTEPDLIKAYGVDGTIGYVRSVDLRGELPKTPDEAAALTKQRIAEGVRQIPLYDVDGKTVIGKFNVGGGHVTVVERPAKVDEGDK